MTKTKLDRLKDGDDILYSCGDMVGSGTVFKIMDGEDIIVQTGNGGRGLEYINKSQVIFK